MASFSDLLDTAGDTDILTTLQSEDTAIISATAARFMAEGLRVADAGRARGLPVFVETRPIYLQLTRERFEQPDAALYVVQPPSRTRANQDALWAASRAGSSRPRSAPRSRASASNRSAFPAANRSLSRSNSCATGS